MINSKAIDTQVQSYFEWCPSCPSQCPQTELFCIFGTPLGRQRLPWSLNLKIVTLRSNQGLKQIKMHQIAMK